MGKYPWKSYSPLRTHDFDDGVLVNGGQPGQLFVCRNCGRRFKFDSTARRTWAVGKGRSFPALQDAITSRWISEACTGGPNEHDESDSKRIKLGVA
jgi:hypothetical protein